MGDVPAHAQNDQILFKMPVTERGISVARSRHGGSPKKSGHPIFRSCNRTLDTNFVEFRLQISGLLH
jgi:hypothetical protein